MAKMIYKLTISDDGLVYAGDGDSGILLGNAQPVSNGTALMVFLNNQTDMCALMASARQKHHFTEDDFVPSYLVN